jgi:hypothetical protein
MQSSTARNVLIASVITLAVTVTWTVDAVAQTAPDAALVGQVPASFASTCTASIVEGADAAITCTPEDVEHVTYARFATPELADAYYDDFVGEDGRDTGSDCADSFESESPFHTAAGGQGRVTCSMGGRENSLTWIAGTTVATATDRTDAFLYEWWDELVGRSLTPEQEALMTQLPRGVNRAECHDNGERSVKCWPLDAEDVYGVFYTQYPDAISMNAAYADVLGDARLGRNVPPPNSKGNTCSYETFWGPLRDGQVSKKLGRLACYEADLEVDLVWTNKDTHVMTRVSAYSPKVAYRYFQQH